jgi:HD-GYP domain-containing protein (c-di-GMP phosphodiesterase class II)
MWSRPEKPVAIDPSQVCIGLFVWLDMSWDDHPFLYNKFRVASDKQVTEIRALRKGRILYFPNKSAVAPAPLVVATTAEAPTESDSLPSDSKAPQQDDKKEEKRRRLCAQKDAAARADRAWEAAAKMAREALLGMATSPKQAGHLLAKLSRETASLIHTNETILLHLLGDKQGEGPHFHALNVMTLSMVLGKAIGLSETELDDLALGSIAHDVGKSRIPQHLLKSATRSRHEEDFYRQHPVYGAELAQATSVFSSSALAVVAGHHEFLDGSGWPQKKPNASTCANIVALVNRYDRLCSPEAPERPALTPSEALSSLYRRESQKFDAKLLSTLIKLLGVYPPGSVVQLSDGTLGLVVSPGRESLRPKVLIYTPEVAKSEAPIVDLGDVTDLSIDEVIRPTLLPPDVLAWLSPRQRLSYFFTTETQPH